MAAINLSALHRPLEAGQYVHLVGSQILVGTNPAWRGESLNEVAQALNNSFNSQTDIWRAAIAQTYQGEGSALLDNLVLLNAKMGRHNSWCRYLTDWVTWFLSFVTGDYQSNQFASIQLDQIRELETELALQFTQGYEILESGLIPAESAVKN